MDSRFDEELKDLKERILAMAARAETNIGDAMRGLQLRDRELLENVIQRDPEIDLAEIQIDEDCLSLLALHQPVARDLRFITTALKIVKDIERIGDMAANIARHGLHILDDVEVQLPADFPKISEAAQTMLERALDAFVNRDAALAREVIESDDLVDRLHKKVVNDLVELMIQDSAVINARSHLMSISKFLERIGDHSSNIAEMVVFMVEGKDIRHLNKVKGLKR